jgi:hypothetical protein
VYFLCKKFFDAKIALVGAALFAFERRTGEHDPIPDVGAPAGSPFFLMTTFA